MAWTRKLPSGRYQGLYRDVSGRACSVGSFVKKSDAIGAGDAERSDKRRGAWIDPNLASIPFGDLSKSWLEGACHTLKPKTIASYESLLSSRILPTFGQRELRTIKPSDITTWVGDMVSGGLSPSRIRQAHVVLRLVLENAVRDGLVMRNAAVGVKLPRLEHREAPFFEPDVVDTISDALEAPYDALVAVLGICGLRFGEAVALRRRHVDGLRRRLAVEESLAEISGELVFGTTKSHARRSVPLSPRVMAMLNNVVESKGPDELVFTGPLGGPVRYRNFLARVWHPTLRKLGLPVMGVHVLRHSAAARMIGAGASPKTLQTVLGHRSAAFSLTVYGHLFDADLNALADRLDNAAPKVEGTG